MLVPLAVSLLLFDANLKRVIKHSGTLFMCFILGSLGTILGTILGVFIVPLNLGSDGWKVASALAARHIGGAVNFVSVSETLGISADVVVASLAADNLIVAIYFGFLFYLAKSDNNSNIKTAEFKETDKKFDVGNENLSCSLAIGCLLTFLGNFISKEVFKGNLSGIPITTLITVFGATLLPNVFYPLVKSSSVVGILLIHLFFSVTGAAGNISLVIKTAPSIVVFSFVQIAVHFLFITKVGKIMKLPFNQLLLASNANVGGPTTAAGFAASKKWSKLVLPALLTGILGYASGTFIGIALGKGLLQKI